MEDGVTFLEAVVSAQDAGYQLADYRALAEQVQDDQGEVRGTA